MFRRSSMLLVTVLAVVVAALFSTASSASAEGGGTHARATTHIAKATPVLAASRVPSKKPYISEGGCGFLQRCIYLSRNEQLILLAGGSAVIIAAICGASLGDRVRARQRHRGGGTAVALEPRGCVPDHQAQAVDPVFPVGSGQRVRNVTAMDTRVRRMIAGTIALLLVVVFGSLHRNSPGLTVAMAVAVVLGAGLVVGCYFYARRGGRHSA
jgi:hypothetical protein